MENDNMSHMTDESVFTKYGKPKTITNHIYRQYNQLYNANRKDNTCCITRNGDKGVSLEFDTYHINRKQLPNSKRVLETKYQDFIENKVIPYTNAGSWNELMNKTSGEESILSKNKRICNSNTFNSNVFPDPNSCIPTNKQGKRAVFADHINKTQITTLPGGVKWDKYKIKDDVDFRVVDNEARRFKMKRDFNSDLDYSKAEPIGVGYNVNEFPTEKRFQGSYKRYDKENDIFNLKQDVDEEIKPFHKKQFNNNKTFKSQIVLC